MRVITCSINGAQQAALINRRGGAVLSSDIWGESLSVLELIRLCEKSGALTRLTELDAYPSRATDGITLLAPIPRPARDIICLGKNYLDHVNEVPGSAHGEGAPAQPIYFGKSAFSVAGPGAVIPRHAGFTDAVDYEAELAVIIGKTASKVSETEAPGHIFGYTALNDVSARDVQTRHNQWYLGKSLDGFAPMGPAIVTADEFSFPPKLNICSRVNGQTRQSANTGIMLFSISYVISQLSQAMTLHPGDIIATGTPSGVGMGFTPPKLLSSGDVVEIEIEGIGILCNTVR